MIGRSSACSLDRAKGKGGLAMAITSVHYVRLAASLVHVTSWGFHCVCNPGLQLHVMSYLLICAHAIITSTA